MSSLPIEEHGVIGNLRTAALVGLNGTIDFLCIPSFDAPSVFAALLDKKSGGCFELRPERFLGAKQLYLPDTNVLMTRFLTDSGAVEVVDAMPIDEHRALLIREVRCVRGSVEMRMRCAPRFDYAQASHRVERRAGSLLFRRSGDGWALRLASGHQVEPSEGDGIARFCLEAGESSWFVLGLHEEGGEMPHLDLDTVRTMLSDTANYWRRWIRRCRYDGRWREVVRRSALTLKLLISEEHGAIVAAPTFGLPEIVGGASNWDYRYAWIRDASFTISALMRLGFHGETTQFVSWLMKRHEDTPSAELQTLYGISGNAELTERTLSHWDGYRGSRPVRVGNAAAHQLQLDIYGEFLSAVDIHDYYGYQIHYNVWRRVTASLNWLCENWSRPDHGIWEIRGPPREYLHSRLLCWVALNRGLNLANRRGLPAPVERWREQRDAIHANIHEHFWNDEEKAFVQTPERDRLDASVLVMPRCGFVSPTDPRWLSTLSAIERRLVSGPLVRRYAPCSLASHHDDQSEGTFNICTFWYVEALARCGRVQEARLVFEKMLGYGNHLGLFSEEMSAKGEQLGNFPQALTHLGLIHAAEVLNEELDVHLRA